MIRGFDTLEKETRLPVLVGSHYSPWECQVVYDLNEEGIRIYNRLDEIAQLLSALHDYSRKRQDLTT